MNNPIYPPQLPGESTIAYAAFQLSLAAGGSQASEALASPVRAQTPPSIPTPHDSRRPGTNAYPAPPPSGDLPAPLNFRLPETLRLRNSPPMNRIVERFARLQREKRKGFIVYIGAGDPDLTATRELALAFDQAGVDILELGVPFSDPLADGLVNQLAAQRGLASGATPPRVLETVARIRRRSQIPVVLYIYFNLVHKFGMEAFIRKAADAGVDGLLVLDLPPEEGGNYERLMAEAGLCNIYLVAPTTPEDRLEWIVKRARGFVYYVSREGVTGMQSTLSDTIAQMTAHIRSHTDLPVAVGFGISTPDQAATVARSADAVVVGSAVVNQIAQLGPGPDLVPQTTALVSSLVQAVKSV